MTHSKVFISYSHDSPEHADRVLAFANRLRSDGIDCILDQYEPAPSEGWPRWMDKQIRQADFVLMICTEIYYKRVMGEEKPGTGRGVRWEGNLIYNQIYQNDTKNTRFIPVLFQDCSENNIPASLQGFTYYWIESKEGYEYLYRRLTNQLPKKPDLGELKQLPTLSRRTDFFAGPFMAPNLPEYFVPRPQLYDSLLQLLLSVDQQSPIAITTSLHGAGGYGKTTMAAALCHDPKVRERFNDGILWVTLGVKPNHLESLSTLYFALTGERPGFKDINQAVENLTLALANRNCLLVIDDVWEYADLVPFLRGASNCIRLFTTRNFELACEGSLSAEVDQMTLDESVGLLLGEAITGEIERQSFNDLADRFCRWPLLLELAGKVLHYRLKCGEKLLDAIRFLNRVYDDKGIIAFDSRNHSERNQAVAKTISVSLDLLTIAERENYLQLAIFPEDINIPFTTLSQLWNLTDLETEELLGAFNKLALINLNLGNRTIRIHDELRLYLISQTKDVINGSHKKLLTTWRDFYQLPDQYAWKYLSYHLVNIGGKDHLRSLLTDYRWLKGKLTATDINALLSDFNYLPSDQVLKLIHGSLRLASHILSWDKSQLKSQLYGRLLGFQELEIQEILRQILSEEQESPWLRPLFPCFVQPGGFLLRTLVGHFEQIKGVAVTADGRIAVSASGDHTLKVWDLKSGQELHSLTGHTGWVSGVAVTADGGLAVSTSGDHTLKVWDLKSGQELHSLTGHTGWVSGVAVTADGGLAVSSSWDKTLKVWDLKSGQELHTLTGHANLVYGVAVTVDGGLAVSASADKTLKVWDLRSGQESYTLTGHTDGVNGVAVTADGGLAVSASTDKTLKVWDLKSGHELHTLTGHANLVNGVAVTTDGGLAVSASTDKTLKVWDLKSGQELYTLTGHTDWVNGVAVTADGGLAISASADETLKVWDLKSGRELHTLTGHTAKINGVAITVDGGLAFSASSHTLKIWDLKSGQELHNLTGHTGWVSGVAVTADGEITVLASGDHILKVWDLKSGQELHILPGHTARINGVAIMAVGGLPAVSASDDHTFKIRDLISGQEFHSLTGHTGWVISGVAVTADGEIAVSASGDHTLKVWDLKRGECIISFTGEASFNTCTIGSDGKTIVAGDDIGRVYFLQIEGRIN